ncbi:MAG: hypothetical protein IPI49_16910 [Myxococcales bacterium]|jgi:hypothetical protein|nr:hypothetical protein [Myxococcales bacterium]
MTNQPSPPDGAPPMGSTVPAPDLPEVPAAKMSRFAKVILGFGVLIVGGYTAAASSGWEPGQPTRDEIPASVRSSPGGYRTFHFWHSGYHGGK